MGKTAAIVLYAAGVALFGCAGLKTGPFVQPGAKPCSGDNYCPFESECRFQSVDSRAVCVKVAPGQDPLTAYPRMTLHFKRDVVCHCELPMNIAL